jgi:hypothetical protein
MLRCNRSKSASLICKGFKYDLAPHDHHADLNNSNLEAFLAEEPPEWSAVRWLVVDGVSGDVLQARCGSRFATENCAWQLYLSCAPAL